MAEFILSAFADEYSHALDKQIEALVKHGITMIEPRIVDGINIADLSPEKTKEVRKKLDDAGIGISAIGSPIGTIPLTDYSQAHMDRLKRTCEIAAALGTSGIRMFSFRVPDGQYDQTRQEVIDRLGEMLDIADSYGMVFHHENEKEMWGNTPERCRDLLDVFGGRLRLVFDPANFIQTGCLPFENCFPMLKDYISYLHIKDAMPGGVVVPAGQGIGGIPEMLSILSAERSDNFILTVEPHLSITNPVPPDAVPGSTYPSSEESFAAAVKNLRSCLNKLSV